MKIVLLGTAYPYRGGIASFIHRLGEEYVNEGHQVEIITFTCQYPNFLFPGTSQYNEGPNPTMIPITRKVSSVNPLNWLAVGRMLAKKKPDLIICKFWMPFFGPSFGTIFRLVKRNQHTKIACVVDNIIPHEKRFMDRPFAQYFANTVDYFIVMSESVQSDMKLFTKNQPVSLVRHPIYDNYGDLVDKADAIKKLHLDPEYTYILFFGFIRAYKGLDLLIEAMGDVYFYQNKIKLLVAGEYYDDEEVYKNNISKLTHPEVVIEHTHFIADDEVRYYFGAADLVVQPYKTATQSGISQLAIYFEKPMVVTDVGGLKEIIGDEKGGYVVNPNPRSIQAGIKRYMEDTDQSAMISYIRDLKKTYSWSSFYQELIRLHEQQQA